MKVFFEAEVDSYFTAYKLTLVPGENVIPKDQEDNVRALIKAHEQDCKRTRNKAKSKPRIRLVEEKKPPAKVETSATPAPPKPEPTKKGAK